MIHKKVEPEERNTQYVNCVKEKFLLNLDYSNNEKSLVLCKETSVMMQY